MTDTKLCPYCGEEIKAVAIKCKHCGERLDLTSSSSPGVSPSAPTAPPGSSPSAPTVLAGAALGEAPPGTKIGSYILGHVLGTGGMGSVYQARHERLGNPVAIKVLAPNLARDQDLIARFEQEARLQANLRHPNIVAVTDFLVDAGLCAFVMELVEGRTLSEVLREQGSALPPQRCHELLRPVLLALGFAHDQGIIHRDIKPSNIMVANAGGSEVVKVMDFGIAKALGGAKRTATGSMMGTLHYMSPEQCQDSKSADSRSDLYSVGVMLYEMATGRLPFERDSDFQMMTAHICEAPPPPRQVNPALSPAFEALIVRSIAKDASYRYQRAEALLADLEGVARGAPESLAAPAPPVQAKPDPDSFASRPPMPVSPMPITTPPASSSRGLLYAIGGAGAFLVVVMILLVWGLSSGGSSGRRSPESSSFVAAREPAPASSPPAREDRRSHPPDPPPPEPEPDPPEPPVDLTRRSLQRVSASSELRDSGVLYSALKAADGRARSAWGAARGRARGEWLELRFTRSIRVTELKLLTGYCARNRRSGTDLFPINRRIKRARFSIGSRDVAHSFIDSPSWQTVRIDPPATGRTVRVTILDVYQGTRFPDLHVSEIAVWGHPARD